ncbi:MAG: DUF2164 family protein [Candidatus Saccharimonadales bacterium]
MKRKFDTIPEEIAKRCVAEVMTRIEEIESEKVGIIAAEDVIDIVLQNYGPEIYNLALADVKKLLQEQQLDTEAKIDLLEQFG